MNTLQGNLEFKTLGVEVSQDKTWVDPVVGLALRSPREHRAQARVYTEIGGLAFRF